MRFLALLALSGSPLLATPGWIERPPTEDGAYKYYIGRATSDSEAAAFKEANASATDQAVRENFGIQVSVQDDTYQSTDLKTEDVKSVKRLTQRSDSVSLKGFEQKDSFVERDRFGTINVWVLYRYSKSALATEKARLAAKNPEVADWSEVGRGKQKGTGVVVEVSTTPPGAEVSIDGEVYGKTPVRISGRVSVGEHKITLDHPQFEKIEEKMLASTDKTNSIDKILVPATGTLTLGSSPTGAEVWLEGRLLGKTPMDSLNVASGKKLSLEFLHEESERLVQEVQVARGENKTVRVTLLSKPARLTIRSEPNGAEVAITRGFEHVKHGQTPILNLELEPGPYKLEVSKPGFETFRTEVVLKGGAVLEPIVAKLVSGTEDRAIAALEAENPTDEKRRVQLAQKWRQYVYRGFPDTSIAKECYELSKNRVKELEKQKTSSAFRELVEISEGEIASDSPMVANGRRLLDDIMKQEEDCRGRNSGTKPYAGQVN